MKKPSRRKAKIDMARMSAWTSLFAGYRQSVTEQRIDRWLNQFKENDRDLAARILDCVDFITYEQMTNAFRSILKSLNGWHIDESHRSGKWRFVAFSLSAGESGDTMLHRFRLANKLNGKQYSDLFIHKSELLRENLGPEDTVVFVDDFSGTGKQVSEAWADNIEELLPGNPNIFLVLVAASVSARKKIEKVTRLMVNSYIELADKDNIFSSECKHFTLADKNTILVYCEKADKRRPKGFGDCGFVIAFAHNCPNNSIPVLHAHHSKWEGLFRRYD